MMHGKTLQHAVDHFFNVFCSSRAVISYCYFAYACKVLSHFYFKLPSGDPVMLLQQMFLHHTSWFLQKIHCGVSEIQWRTLKLCQSCSWLMQCCGFTLWWPLAGPVWACFRMSQPSASVLHVRAWRQWQHCPEYVLDAWALITRRLSRVVSIKSHAAVTDDSLSLI